MEEKNRSVFFGSLVRGSICKDQGVKQDNLNCFPSASRVLSLKFIEGFILAIISERLFGVVRK
jgi:hypothetical protein